MKAVALGCLLLAAACAAPPRVATVSPQPDIEPPPQSGPEIWAYHAYWMGEAWRVHDLRAFRRLLFFDLVVGRDGRIAQRHGWPEQWEALRARAQEARVPLDPVVTVLDRATFTAIFASPDASARLLAEATELARGAAGLHLDIEVLDPVDEALVARFRAFVAQLRGALDAPARRTLTAFVTARGNLYGPPELAMLDAVVAQGYDVHWQGGDTSGPVALLAGNAPGSWQSMAQTLAQLGVTPRKIVFSSPLYGYEWPTVSAEPRARTRGAGAIITYAPIPPSLLPDLRVSALARAAQHGLRREAATSTPWYAFRDADGWRQGWFDDPVSLAPRLEFVRRGDYRGVAFFVLGYDGGALIEAAQDAFRAGTGPARGTGRVRGP